MTVLYTDIRELVTNDPANGEGDPLGIIGDAALVVDGTEIVWVGRRADAPDADHRVSCGGTSVIPGFVDSHTMLCCQMAVKSLKVPPADQAFNRIADEITLDLATRPKDRSSLGPYHPHLIACLG